MDKTLTPTLERLQKDTQDYINKLKQDQVRLLASINSLSLGFIIVDVKSNILIKNNAVDQILGLKDLEGNVLLKGDIVNITQRLKGSFDLQTKWEESLKEKKSFEFKDISFGTKFLKIFIAPIIMEQSDAIGVVILIEDVTEAKILERSKDEFFSIASHELRTPLTAIRGNISLIRDFYGDKLPDKEIKQMIDDIHDSTVRLIKIVNDFLNLSRIEQGRLEFKPITLDLIKMIEGAIVEVTPNALAKQLYLKFEKPTSALPQVFADQDRLKEVLINLLGNGINYTEKGGITVKIAAEPTFVKVLVSDTGKGIPPENQSLLFRKFQQAGSILYTRDVSRSTGLGLYISKLMVEGMGGKIQLESSEVDKGSTFFFTIPIAKVEK